MHQEHDVSQRDQDDLFDQGPAERVDRRFNQVGPVVERDDRDALRQSRLDLGDARLDGVDDGLRVHAGTRDHDTANGLAGAFDQRGDPKRVADPHVRDLIDIHGHAVRAADHNFLDVIHRRDQPHPTHDQPRAVGFEDVSAHVVVALAYCRKTVLNGSSY